MIALLAQTASGSGDEFYLLGGFILLAAAVGLLVLELFVPSGGMIGLLCGVAAVCSVVAFFRYDTTWGLASLGLYVVLGPVIVIFGLKLWVRSPFARRMILGADQDLPDHTAEESREVAERARRTRLADLNNLIGAEGTSITALRPVGFVRIAGQRLDAMAESGVIEPNTPVVVVEVYDNQIKVRPR